MKQKNKFGKNKSYYNNYNLLVNSAPALENLQINSLKNKKANLSSNGNLLLAFNHVFIILCLLYLVYTLFQISNYIVACEIYCILCTLNLVSCLFYLISSSFLIIAIKERIIELYSNLIS